MSSTVQIYDSTLRDGAQAVGITFSQSGKVRFARKLDEFGIDFIEGGYAGSNPKDMQFFNDIKKEKLSHSKIVAFGSTRRAGQDVKNDPFVQALLSAETEYCTVYGKAWKMQVTEILRTSFKENSQMIADTVGYLREKGRRVFFDAEHFFSGYDDDPEFALKVLETAINAGAEAVVLCDTIGGAMPWEVAATTAAVCARFPGVAVGIHAHNDTGMGVANSLAAVHAGAAQVQGCFNGYGERTGNANLTTIIPTLELKMGCNCIGKGKLRELRQLSLFIDDLVNQRPDARAPYVGETSFSHKAGAHVSAVQKNPASFEHVPPESVGNSRKVVMSELSGGANVTFRLKQLGPDYDDISKEEVGQILAELKAQEGMGYTFESADASFQLLVQKALKRHSRAFELEALRVIVEKRGIDDQCVSEATIKLSVDGKTEHTVGEGAGPVEALDHALRKALARFFPQVADVVLTDFRVRILDPKEAAGAVTRVLVESSDGKRSWGTVGVSPNIIEASWQALLDAIEYKLLIDGAKR